MNIDMNNITDTPITREEIGMLFTGSVKAQGDLVKQITKEISEGIKGYFDEQQKQMTAALSKIVDRNNVTSAKIECAMEDMSRQSAEAAKTLGAMSLAYKNWGEDSKKHMAEQSKAIGDFIAKQSNIVENQKKIQEQYLDLNRETIQLIKDAFTSGGLSGSQVKKAKAATVGPSAPSEVALPTLKRYPINDYMNGLWSMMRAIAPKHGISVPLVCSLVYKRMEKKYGTDVDSLYMSPKMSRYSSKMKMCVGEAKLSKQFEDALFELYAEAMCKKESKRQKTYKSVAAMHAPSSIKKACRALAPNIVEGVTLRRIYKKMSDISGIDLNTYIKKNAKAIPFKYFSKAYFIAQDKTLMPLFDKAVEALKEESHVS